MKRGLIPALVLALSLTAVSPAAANEEEPPQGCDGGLRDIHKSTKGASAGRVKVLGWTQCATPVEIITVSVELYRETPAGAVFIGLSPDPTAYGTNYIQRSAVGDKCIPGYYKAIGRHYVKNGTYVWNKTTTQRNYVNCA